MNQGKFNVVNKSESGEQEFDIIDIISFLRVNVFVISICTLLGISGGLIAFSYLPYKWRADVTLQIGKIPVLQSFDYIDPPTEAAEKIQSPLFLSKMGEQMYGHKVNPDSPTGELLYKDLKASVVNGGNLISVHVFGWTAEDAYKNAGILGNAVVDMYQAMAAPYLLETKKQLDNITSSLEKNREMLRKLDSLESESPSRTEANALLKLTLINSKTDEIQKLQVEQTRLGLLLAATNLQQTKIVGRSLLPRKPASPRRGILIIGGALLGLMLGFLLSVSVAVHRRSKKYNSSSS